MHVTIADYKKATHILRISDVLFSFTALGVLIRKSLICIIPIQQNALKIEILKTSIILMHWFRILDLRKI